MSDLESVLRAFSYAAAGQLPPERDFPLSPERCWSCGDELRPGQFNQCGPCFREEQREGKAR